MFELPPLLLALAFILVGLAAWFLGRRNGSARTVRLPRDYSVGLDHLINARFAHAAEIYARMAEAVQSYRSETATSSGTSLGDLLKEHIGSGEGR